MTKAMSGEEALELLTQRRFLPDGILLDCVMGGMVLPRHSLPAPSLRPAHAEVGAERRWGGDRAGLSAAGGSEKRSRETACR